ncbi:MAG TPA: MarC family protein [Sedimentisphaerales bacterium]|nr:MarC family protein [Sedimentisphaerales bacterium]
MVSLFVNMFIKIFFLLTPFFVMTMFLAMTRTLTPEASRRIAIRTSIAILITAFILFYFGNIIFNLLGITTQSFQIGAGALLFLSAVKLVHGQEQPKASESDDIAVVPLAIPLTVGPGTTGTLLVLGAEYSGLTKLVASGALFCAIVVVAVLLLSATKIEQFLGAKRIAVLTKLTGLVLSALAAQLIFTGIYNFPH